MSLLHPALREFVKNQLPAYVANVTVNFAHRTLLPATIIVSKVAEARGN
jgi:hypothetical protein